jgi:pSer/pThr/pTyr-binding forkhead associated (FHA) protein
LLKAGDTYGVEDLDSANGVFVNGERISSEVELVDADSVQVGDAVFIYQQGR